MISGLKKLIKILKKLLSEYFVVIYEVRGVQEIYYIYRYTTGRIIRTYTHTYINTCIYT
jgi:hypothetical protein